MLRELTEKVLNGTDLTFAEANQAINAVLNGQCSEVGIAGFLVALRGKGETANELAGMARAMRDHAVPVRPKSEPVLDIVGTGGDGSCTFNISTTAALVIAGAGVPVAKHGNRAITSKCGSADVLAGLGVKIDAAPAVIEKCIDEAGLGFMFAPCHHPAMKYVQPIRKELGVRTAFNILGPLSNPANAGLQIIGVAVPQLLEKMAKVLKLLGVKRAMVAYGDGMDEFSICGPTDIVELRDGRITSHTVDYSDYGIKKAEVSELTSSSVEENVALTRGILAGEVTVAPRDVVLFNAAAALMIAGKTAGFAEGMAIAAKSIDSGRAGQVLEKMIAISNGG